MAVGLGSFVTRFRTAAWLGWQIESNWADAFMFAVYVVLRPLGTAFILAGVFWAVAKGGPRAETFALFFVANAFHEYVLRVLVGLGWVVVEEREEYETLRFLATAPVGLMTYLWGRAAVKFTLASVSVLLMLVVGWFVLGVRWSWAEVHWGPLALAVVLGLVATACFGILMGGVALILPRSAISVNEGVGVALYLLCGVIFPIDLLPWFVRVVSLALPFTYWYESIRRFLLGHGASALLSKWSDGWLLAALASTTLVLVAAARWGYAALERHARRSGRLDQASLF